ncbi:MAG: DegT/DnrJ/EryC1/StrS family aminotransferase [Acidobacteria bacterium]|nr:DegT/DnrJ/EryC1/StrS family aminotransferase [Acidobacteriota bacterium]
MAASLAVLGGPPAFATPLRTGCPNILDPTATAALVSDAMARRWLTNEGPLVQRLEERFAALHGVRHAVAVANATLGLQLAAAAMGIAGEVVVPSFTFIGTVHAMSWIGLRPVFCDVSADTHTLDAARLEAALTPDTAAIIGVHLWGRPCDIDPIQRVADARGVPVLFDAAHATGSTRGGTPLGRFGRAEVFSLHATKSINGLEGGLVTTTDDDLAERLRRLRNFGFNAGGRVVSRGINAKMNEFSAAMALSNLAGFDRLCAHNRAIHDAYRHGLAGLPGVRLCEHPAADVPSGHYAVIEVDDTAPLGRDALCRVLVAERVNPRRYFRPGCHRSPPYAFEPLRHPLPVTERLTQALMHLPTGLQMNPDDATAMAAVLGRALAEAPRVRAALAAPAP